MLTVIERSGYQFRHSESGWIPKILQQTFQCYQICNAEIGRIIRAGGHSKGFYHFSFFLRSDCDVINILAYWKRESRRAMDPA
jgi:hypothetical protein